MKNVIHHRPKQMPSNLFLLSRRWVLASALALACAAVAPASVAKDAAVPPAPVQKALAGAVLRGEGQLRFLGLRIYDARLWVGPQFEATEFGAHPLALELTYHRAFTGAAIAQRSIEEIQRQGDLAPAQAERWQMALSQALPDVQPGERLTGLYRPGQGMSLWHGNLALVAIDDAELARRFFGIWLSPLTSEPNLRRALLARKPDAAR